MLLDCSQQTIVVDSALCLGLGRRSDCARHIAVLGDKKSAHVGNDKDRDSFVAVQVLGDVVALENWFDEVVGIDDSPWQWFEDGKLTKEWRGGHRSRSIGIPSPRGGYGSQKNPYSPLVR